MSRDHRYSLADARRKYLHYKDPYITNFARLPGDLSNIVQNFEAACDEIDHLQQTVEKLQAENRKLQEENDRLRTNAANMQDSRDYATEY